MASRALEATHAFDEAHLGDMQNGLLWLDESSLATVSLNGDINLLDQSAPGARKALHGHQVGRSVGDRDAPAGNGAR